MLRFAVLGSPISHSLSPVIHRAAYARLGLEWEFARFEVSEGQLDSFLQTRDDSWGGFACTMPLKRDAWKLAHSRDPHAESSGVANTLVRAGDGWHAANTDIPGLMLAFERLQLSAHNTVILGSGATATSAVLAAQHLGAKRIEVRARNQHATAGLAKQFSVQHAPLDEQVTSAPSLVISTLPGDVGGRVELPAALCEAPLFDVAYNPWPSPLVSRWQQHGSVGHSGIHMLIQQAIIQIRMFLADDPTVPLPSEDEVVYAMGQALPRSMGQ